MNHANPARIRIQLRSAEGALLRALGLMERRGFRVVACQLCEARGDGQAMEVTVHSARPVDLLKRQLERLHDVLWVETEATVAPGSATPQNVARRI